MTTTPKTPAHAAPTKAAGAAAPVKVAALKAAVSKAAGPKAAATKAAGPKAAVAKVAAPKAGAAKSPASKRVTEPAAKPAARTKPAPAAPVAAAAAALVGAVSEALSIRKKELVERVVAASGAKRKQVKEIVEHTLKVLGDALAKGEELNLPPFGKAKVNRSRDTDGGTMMMVKLKQGGDQQAARKAARKGAKQGLADAED